MAKFYISNLTTGEEFALAMTPESVSAKTASSFRSFSIIERGEVKFPKGEALTQISWSGTFPSARALSYAFIDILAWRSPAESIKLLTRWRENGDRLRVLITTTPINLDVYLRSFDYEHSGGQGHVKYSVDFIAAKELRVKTVEEADNDAQSEQLEERPPMQEDTKVICRSGETLWALSQAKLGSGARWRELYDVNSRILDDPTSVYPGLEIQLPT